LTENTGQVAQASGFEFVRNSQSSIFMGLCVENGAEECENENKV
jgi:hypothetical protein